MRIKQVLAFLGAAAVSSAVLAAPAASVSADGNTVTVHGHSSRVVRLTPGQAEDAAGAFRLEDGRVLTLTSQRSKVFMEVDGKREQLLPLSRTEFVAANSGARVVLDEEAFAGKVHLTQFRNQ
jgi:ABC-type Fe3+-hydroxamate transport system substrate-binding protein